MNTQLEQAGIQLFNPAAPALIVMTRREVRIVCRACGYLSAPLDGLEAAQAHEHHCPPQPAA